MNACALSMADGIAELIVAGAVAIMGIMVVYGLFVRAVHAREHNARRRAWHDREK